MGAWQRLNIHWNKPMKSDGKEVRRKGKKITVDADR